MTRFLKRQGGSDVMTILVTGGAGLIGSHAVLALLAHVSLRCAGDSSVLVASAKKAPKVLCD